ncbi:hypothetical protein MTO96_003278 [Rhipicephalus appendiculatus]
MLLDCIPNNFDAEAELIAEADKIGAKLDVDFFNMLIKRRAFRREKETAKDVLSMITARDLHPDVVTFGVLALTVHTKKEGSEFLKTMQATGLTVNEETWGTLVCNACFKGNFWFLLDLMGYAKREEHPGQCCCPPGHRQGHRQDLGGHYSERRGDRRRCEWTGLEHPWEQYEPENLKKSAAELKAAAIALTMEQT